MKASKAREITNKVRAKSNSDNAEKIKTHITEILKLVDWNALNGKSLLNYYLTYDSHDLMTYPIASSLRKLGYKVNIDPDTNCSKKITVTW